MTIAELAALDTACAIETDLCLVGSGPAGFAIAEELRDSGLRILVLESGGRAPEPDTTALNEVEHLGVPQHNGRDRVLGGSSHTWSGRCTGLDDIDYAARPWVPLSGWPFGRDAIAPHLDRACQYLGLGPDRPEGRGASPADIAPRPHVDPTLLRPVCWQFSQDTPNPKEFMRLGPRFSRHQDARLRILLHATVTHLNTTPSGARIESVEVADRQGRRTAIRARAVVLCAGGIENARILLCSNRVMSDGVGNAHGVVGRYLMDHPRNMIVQFDPRDAERLRAIFGPYRLPSARGRHAFVDGLALSPALQRREGLLNCAAWLDEAWAADDPVAAAKRLVAGPRAGAVRDVGLVLAEPDILLRALRARLLRGHSVTHKVEYIGFRATSEQCPDPDSRIRLGERRDRLGLPLARIDWRIGAQERASLASLARIIADEFQRLGLPSAHLADWVRNGRHEEAVFEDAAHPTGTTRMASDPRHGVVDADCQVHGVDGLYIAGSSVFPTGGHANPTLMIVALAIRLAQRLRERLTPTADVRPMRQSGDPRPAAQRAAMAPAPTLPPGTTVAVTGATGFIGGRLVERLAEQGAVVTGLLRDAAAGARLHRAGAKTRVLDLADPGAVCAALAGIGVVFHCAYDWDNAEWNLRALRALIAGCQANACHRLVHLSSFVVYRLPAEGEVTEDTVAETSGAGYAHIKHLLEGELMRAVREAALPGTILQPTIVYGPYSRPWTIDPADMLRYGTVVLPDHGEGICNAVYVDDVVSAMILAAQHPAAVGQRFLVSGPAPVTWRDFYEAMARAAGADGPRYRPAAALARDGGPVRKLLRLATDPGYALRRVARAGPGRRLILTCLDALPPGLRGKARNRLFDPLTRRRGQVHLPNLHHLRFLQSRATIGSDKVRRELGYAPAFDFAAGMVPTARFLREVCGTAEAAPVRRPTGD